MSALATLAVLACGGSDATAPTATPTIVIAAGDAQSVTVGKVAPVAPAVVVTDSHGAHHAGITVTFVPDSNAGHVAVASATTDASGLASAGMWTVGTHAVDQHLTASATIDGTTVHVTFTTSPTADIPAAIKIVSGGGQDGPFGATLATPVVVRVADQYDNPNAGVTLAVSIDTGGVTSATVVTAKDGTASTRVRLPRTTGSSHVTIAADSLVTVTSTFTSRGIRFASFDINGNTACGRSVEGYPYCWGDNGVGQLALVGAAQGQNVLTPQAITGDFDFSSISLENIGGCGLRMNGAAVCWGSNGNGENGNGATSTKLDAPMDVVGNLSFVEVMRGPSATCAATKSGQAYCWGGGGVGQVGAASVYQGTTSHPVAVDGGLALHSLALGTLHSCALDPSGQAYCWGMNLEGRVGVPAASRSCNAYIISSTGVVTISTTCAPSPVAVVTPIRFTSLTAAADATCGLTAAGDTYCWGSNDFGQLGTGGFVSDTVPTKVAGVPAFKEIHGHDRGFCGLTSAGDIYCWGYVSSVVGVPYQNCTAYNDCTPTPTKVQVTLQFSTIAFTTGQLCGLSNGVAYCWGNDVGGSLGIGIGDGVPVRTPTPIASQAP